jgi:type 2A phosphatase activator TIP41
MTFGNNSLSLSYSSTEGDVEMKFNGLDALAEVGVGEGWEDRTGGAVLVAMAEFWGKNRLVDPFTFNSTLY